jgi:hypothetical protein
MECNKDVCMYVVVVLRMRKMRQHLDLEVETQRFCKRQHVTTS